MAPLNGGSVHRNYDGHPDSLYNDTWEWFFKFAGRQDTVTIDCPTSFGNCRNGTGEESLLITLNVQLDAKPKPDNFAWQGWPAPCVSLADVTDLLNIYCSCSIAQSLVLLLSIVILAITLLDYHRRSTTHSCSSSHHTATDSYFRTGALHLSLYSESNCLFLSTLISTLTMSMPSGPSISAEDHASVSSKVHWAVDRLKEKFPASVKYDDLLSYCWAGQDSSPTRTTYWDFWTKNKHTKIVYDRESNSFRFRPLHDIASADDLVKFLQTQPTANGLQVKDLKDGWPDVEDAVDQLEEEHKVLVHRNKKDGRPRIVWADSPDLYAPLDSEFLQMWTKIALPSPEDTIKELAKIGYKPAGTVKDTRKVAAPTGVKKSRKIRGYKQTNTHMAHLFKDFSGKRAQAGPKK